MPPGLAMRCGDSIRKPVGRLHFAGSETAQRCVGYIEGGLEAGLRVEREVMAATPPEGGAGGDGGHPPLREAQDVIAAIPP